MTMLSARLDYQVICEVVSTPILPAGAKENFVSNSLNYAPTKTNTSYPRVLYPEVFFPGVPFPWAPYPEAPYLKVFYQRD